MSSLLTPSAGAAFPLGPDDGRAVTAEESVRQQVWSLLAGFYPPRQSLERRREQRFPLGRLVHLTPVATGSAALEADPIVVVGKDISERGLGFYHPQPLTHRRMVASLQTHSGRWIAFLIDIHWCRFTYHGWYDSGGRFLQTVTSPVGPV